MHAVKENTGKLLTYDYDRIVVESESSPSRARRVRCVLSILLSFFDWLRPHHEEANLVKNGVRFLDYYSDSVHGVDFAAVVDNIYPLPLSCDVMCHT